MAAPLVILNCLRNGCYRDIQPPSPNGSSWPTAPEIGRQVSAQSRLLDLARGAVEI
jgi:hypothetical protein